MSLVLNGNAPAFSANQSITQTPSSGVFTKGLFQTEVFDVNSNYDNSTSRFTPTVAGYYLFTSAVQFATNSYATRIGFYKNGSAFYYGPQSSTGTAAGGSVLIYLNGSTDYVELYIYTATSQATTAGTGETYFQGVLVRGA